MKLKKSYKTPRLRQLSAEKVKHLTLLFEDSPEFQRRMALLDEIWNQRLKKEKLPSAWQSREAWAILIELYRCHLVFELPSIKQVQLATSIPQATALRRLASLEEEKWVERVASETDQRVVLLRPSARSIKVLNDWADTRSDYLLMNQLHGKDV